MEGTPTRLSVAKGSLDSTQRVWGRSFQMRELGPLWPGGRHLRFEKSCFEALFPLDPLVNLEPK